MKKWMSALVVGGLAIGTLVSGVWAQVDNPDYRIRAEFRIPETATYAPGSSVGHAEFRVVERFGQLYYGGVIRQDEYKFRVQFDFTEKSDFPAGFPGSVFNTDMDVYIENGFVARVTMNNPTLGFGELVYDSRHPTPPELLIPAAFPREVNLGDTARVYAAAGAVPEIGSPLPVGEPLLISNFGEEFARGDANHDKDVDELDYQVLDDNYDPSNNSGPHIGPMAGDFTGDNRCDRADYDMLAMNWTSSAPVPPAPGTITPPCAADFNASGGVTTQDIFDFLASWFSGDVAADVNASGDVTVQDIFEFLAGWFQGC